MALLTNNRVTQTDPTRSSKAPYVKHTIGPHFNGNPHQLEQDVLVRHGEKIIQLENRSFEGIRTYLEQHCIEGIVFWKDGMPGCKIKRRDFGFDWPIKRINTYDSKKEV